MIKNIEWLKKEFDDLFNGKSILTVGRSVVDEILNQLDEPEVLSQEWIDEHLFILGDKYPWKEAVPVVDLQNTLVPKQELPVIPKFVAYVIEAYKSNSRLTNLLADLAFHGVLAEFIEHEDEDEVFEWARSNRKAADEILARAWLYGYEVEEEQKYYVVSTNNRMMLVRMMDGETIAEAVPYEFEDVDECVRKSYQLTEQEIKDYDPRYMTFAKPVEELEE